jgi:hypothetical protein
VTQASSIKLDSGSRFPDVEFQLLDGTKLTLPKAWSGHWGSLLFYRGHW